MAGNVPTKSNLMAAQKSLKLAKLGYELLDRKKNILIRELMQYTDGAKDIKGKCAEAYKKAYEALRMASLTMGRCGSFANRVPVDDSLEFSSKSVMGMSLPSIECKEPENYAYFGLIDTNGYMDEAYKYFNEAKKLTASLAALGNVQIPKLTEKIKLMSEALDEKEREEFSRLKMIKKS